MLSADNNKPVGKPGQRNRKKKSGQRTKSGQQHATGMDQLPHAPADASRESAQKTTQVPVQETVDATIEETIHAIGEEIRKALPQETHQVTGQQVSPPLPSTEDAPAEASAMAGALVISADLGAVSPQTVANAYADYARKSLEQIWTFVGRLAAARSPAEAFELQMQFAKEACETFVAESQKISDLHGELAKQRVMHLEGFVARVTQTELEPHATRH